MCEVIFSNDQTSELDHIAFLPDTKVGNAVLFRIESYSCSKLDILGTMLEAVPTSEMIRSLLKYLTLIDLFTSLNNAHIGHNCCHRHTHKPL